MAGRRVRSDVPVVACCYTMMHGIDLTHSNSDYQVLDDDFWDEEFGAAPSRPGLRRVDRGPRIGGRRADHDSVLARYKVMQVQMQDRHGNFFVMKKRISYD